jgi:hypothetical protein
MSPKRNSSNSLAVSNLVPADNPSTSPEELARYWRSGTKEEKERKWRLVCLRFAKTLKTHGASPMMEPAPPADFEGRLRYYMAAEAATRVGMIEHSENMQYMTRSLGNAVPHPRVIDPAFKMGGTGTRTEPMKRSAFGAFELRSFYLWHHCTKTFTRAAPPNEKEAVLTSLKTFRVTDLTKTEVTARWLDEGRLREEHREEAGWMAGILDKDNATPSSDEGWVDVIDRIWKYEEVKPT